MTKQTKQRIIAVALAGLILFTVGCDADTYDFVRALALEWAKANAGDILKNSFLGRSGNDEVDAVMGAKNVVDNINAADQLMDEGRAEGDLAKMEEAINKRPGDYTYRVSYGTELLEQGYSDEAADQFSAADQAVQNYPAYHQQEYAIQGIEELSVLREGYETNGFANKQQCKLYYERMAYFYQIRYDGTQDSFFQSQVATFQALANGCQ